MEKMGKEHSNFASIGEKTAVIKEAEHIEIGELFKGAPSVIRNNTSGIRRLHSHSC